MAFGDIVNLSEIPYLDRRELSGRFISTLTFHDDVWRMWMSLHEEGKFVEVRAWPAEALYFARQAESKTDFHSLLLTFIAQRANFSGLEAPFSGIRDDFFNLSASLAKLDLIFKASSESREQAGSSRLAATEVEYILLVCRSLFDLLQEILAKLWGTVILTDGNRRTKALKKTFSDMTLYANTLKSGDQITKQFDMPAFLAACYVRHAPLFLKIREFRDNLVHRGQEVQTIFRGEAGFMIAKRLGPFLDLNIWREDEILPNDLVPLKPALSQIVHGTLAACEDFACALATNIQFPNPIVPGMQIFMRGYFNDALAEAIVDAEQRLGEGRTFIR